MRHALTWTTLAVALVGSPALADAPNVPTPPPYIVLADNIDEPNGYGFCLDTKGRGQGELMHSHSCKPDRGENSYDVRFRFDTATGQIQSNTYAGQCVQVLRSGRSSEFALLPCSEAPGQKFTTGDGDGTIRLASDAESCMIVAPNTRPAGPWVARDLQLASCAETEDIRKRWTIVAE